jgi:hypothetical protein
MGKYLQLIWEASCAMPECSRSGARTIRPLKGTTWLDYILAKTP